MNIYDFDGTIYKGDSGVDFIKYSFKKKPFLVISNIFKTIPVFIKYLFNKKSFTDLKSQLFAFVNKINNLDDFVNKFVDTHKKKIYPYYLKNKEDSDLIITASLDFYVIPLCKKIGIKNIISTQYDISNGIIIGNNCHGKEKVNSFNKNNLNETVKNVYGDSSSDIYMFELGTGYVLDHGKVEKYSSNYKFKKSLISIFLDKDFILFILCGFIGTLTNFLFSSLISIKINPIISYIFGYLISLFVSYYCNIKLVFKRKINILDFIRFVISYIPNFIILTGCVYLFINICGINKILVYLLVAILAIPITYILVKVFAFKSRKKVIKDL